MKAKLKKIIKKPFLLLADYVQFVVGSAAENQFRLHTNHNWHKKFTSYKQLKLQHSRLRKFVFIALLFFLGMLASQIIFPYNLHTKIFIPENEGEILISNVGKNGATIVFKTLDEANFKKPLATTAFVSVYADKDMQNLVKTTDPDDFAVTHMINITGLENDKDYYLKLTAMDVPEGEKSQRKQELAYVAGKEKYLKLHTGEIESTYYSCEERLLEELAKRRMGGDSMVLQENNGLGELERSFDVETKTDEDKNVSQTESGVFQITNILHENALYDQNRIQTIVSWRTDKKSNTAVIYREGKMGETKELIIGNKMDLVHMAVFTSFKPGVVYYFKVKSMDEQGNVAISKEFSFLTPRQKETFGQVMLNNLKQIFRGILPTK